LISRFRFTGLVSDLQIDVKAGNSSTNVISSELALIKFRTSNNEAEILLLKKKLEVKP
jgi:hypothetical protein